MSPRKRLPPPHGADLHAAVSELVRVYQFRDRDHICCRDISVTQCYALENLVHDGPMRLGTLAARLFLDKSTTSRVVQTLVRKGYARHQRERSDKRAMVLRATAAGQRLHRSIVRDLVAQQHALIGDLTPAVRRAVVDVIQKLARAADARFRGGVSAGCGGTGKCP
jgi:MarR family 2-MHQ and catechol resistance regulon transcriptional repressor